jgi:hypothetical protein
LALPGFKSTTPSKDGASKEEPHGHNKNCKECSEENKGSLSEDQEDDQEVSRTLG